jgi:hypothetical protein
MIGVGRIPVAEKATTTTKYAASLYYAVVQEA